MHARRSTFLLSILGKLRPQAWDAIVPHGPKIGVATREYMIAMALKGFSAELGAGATTARLKKVQKELVSFAAGRLVADYDDDNWCPTPPRPPLSHPVPSPIPVPAPGPDPDPWPISFSEVMLNPQPLPPRELARQIGAYIVLLSEATTIKDVARELHAIGSELEHAETGSA
jgi:hypothetical protein